jgi:hypothetical protein
MRLAMPDGAVTGIQIEGARLGATASYNGRIVDVDNPRHEKALRELGAFPANLGGRARGGFRCACGFASFFRRCSRCDGTCEREV